MVKLTIVLLALLVAVATASPYENSEGGQETRNLVAGMDVVNTVPDQERVGDLRDKLRALEALSHHDYDQHDSLGEKFHLLEAVERLEDHARQETERQINPLHVESVKKDFFKFLSLRHQYEHAEEIHRAVESHGNLLEVAYNLFSHRMGFNPHYLALHHLHYPHLHYYRHDHTFNPIDSLHHDQDNNGLSDGDKSEQGGSFREARYGPRLVNPYLDQPWRQAQGHSKAQLIGLWKLFMEFEVVAMEQKHIQDLNLDPRLTHGLFFQSFLTFLEHAKVIRHKTFALGKLENLLEASQARQWLETLRVAGHPPDFERLVHFLQHRAY